MCICVYVCVREKGDGREILPRFKICNIFVWNLGNFRKQKKKCSFEFLLKLNIPFFSLSLLFLIKMEVFLLSYLSTFSQYSIHRSNLEITLFKSLVESSPRAISNIREEICHPLLLDHNEYSLLLSEL